MVGSGVVVGNGVAIGSGVVVGIDSGGEVHVISITSGKVLI